MAKSKSCLLAAASLVAIAGYADISLAQDLKRDTAMTNRESLLNALAKGKSIISQGEHYVYLPKVRAVYKAGIEDAREHLAALGVQALDVLAVKGGFVLYTSTDSAMGATALTLTQQGGQTYFPVVLNERTGQFGVVTGSIAVELTDPGDALAIREDHGVQLKRNYRHLGVAVFQTAPGQDLSAVIRGLVADPRVESAEAEIIEHFNVPH